MWNSLASTKDLTMQGGLSSTIIMEPVMECNEANWSPPPLRGRQEDKSNLGNCRALSELLQTAVLYTPQFLNVQIHCKRPKKLPCKATEGTVNRTNSTLYFHNSHAPPPHSYTSSLCRSKAKTYHSLCMYIHANQREKTHANKRRK